MFKPVQLVISTRSGQEFMVLEPRSSTYNNGHMDYAPLKLDERGILVPTNERRLSRAPERFCRLSSNNLVKGY